MLSRRHHATPTHPLEAEAPLALRHPLLLVAFPEPGLVFPVEPVGSIPPSWDPMVEKAALGTTFAASGRSFREEIAVMVEHQANPPLTAMSPCLSNPLPPVDF
jgi:hypothetical protein